MFPSLALVVRPHFLEESTACHSSHCPTPKCLCSGFYAHSCSSAGNGILSLGGSRSDAPVSRYEKSFGARTSSSAQYLGT